MALSPMFQLSSDVVDDLVALSPVLGTTSGVGGAHAGWDDLGPDGTAALDALWRRTLHDLDAVELGDAWDALASDVLRDHCDAEIAHVQSGDHLFDLNILASNFQTASVVFEMTQLNNAADVEAVVTRLHTVGELLEGYQRRLAEGLASGRVVARRQVLAVLAQGRQHASERSVLSQVAERAATVDPSSTERLAAGVLAGRAAFSALTDWLASDYLPAAPTRDAVGSERYQRAAARHLGLEIDLEETERWGWSEVRRLEARMQELAHTLSPGATVGETVAALRRDPRWCDPTPEVFLERMQALQDDAVEKLHGTHFDVPALVQHIEVVMAPPGGPLGAYYRMPSEDLSRPGAVVYRLEQSTQIPFFHEVSTAYHEGFPGHHLQLATAVQLSNKLSRFQRLFAHNTGHAEGWALYAEQLMLELGFFDHPALELGQRINELARAYRVVVDIGLHLERRIPDDVDFHPGERWDFDLAVEAMSERAMLTPQTARDNVVRYLGWPGQAITYKVGERVILDARNTLCGANGLPLPAFHARVIEGGSVGLGRLKQRLTGSR